MPVAASKRKHSAAFTAPRSSKANGAKPGRKSNASRREPSSDEEEEDDDDDESDDFGQDDQDQAAGSDDDDGDSTSSQPTAAAAASKTATGNPPPSIPPKLLAKILHHNLEKTPANKSMRIDKDAMSTLGRYIETFTREAIARAAFERGEMNAEREKKGERIGAGEGFLEVEDLEKLAPQLLLDF